MTRVRFVWVLSVRFLFGSSSVKVHFGFIHICYFGFGSVLGKIWVLVRFVLAWIGFFFISSLSEARDGGGGSNDNQNSETCANEKSTQRDANTAS